MAQGADRMMSGVVLAIFQHRGLREAQRATEEKMCAAGRQDHKLNPT